MTTEERKAKLRQAFLEKAEAVFEAAVERGTKQALRLSELEETVAELKFDLTRVLVESMIGVQDEVNEGPGPKCDKCGEEM